MFRIVNEKGDAQGPATLNLADAAAACDDLNKGRKGERFFAVEQLNLVHGPASKPVAKPVDPKAELKAKFDAAVAAGDYAAVQEIAAALAK